MDSIDDKDITDQWCKDVDNLPIPKDYLELYKVKYFCEDWRNIELTSPEWRQYLYDCTLKLSMDKK